MLALFSASPVLAVEAGALIDLGHGKVAVQWPAGAPTVLSVQPDGTYQTRPKSSIGPWETAIRQGNRLLYRVEDRWYVVLLVAEEL